MQEEGRLIEQVFGRLGVLRDDGLREPLEPALLLGGEIARRAHDQRAFAERALAAQLLDELDSVHVGQPEVDDGAVEALLRERGECLARGGDRRRVNVSVPDQLDDPIALALVALDEEAVLHGPAAAPRVASTALKPWPCARSTRIRANGGSSSITSRRRSLGRMSCRSSPTSSVGAASSSGVTGRAVTARRSIASAASLPETVRPLGCTCGR